MRVELLKLENEKMKMESADLFESNVTKIGELFPEALTESFNPEGIFKKQLILTY